MENKSVTAVEWLYKHLFPKQLDGFSDEEWKKIDTAFEKAKAMEKEQMNEIHLDGIEQGYNMRYQQEKQKNN
jgi:hypothetical protein